jgi:hypothetical protein
MAKKLDQLLANQTKGIGIYPNPYLSAKITLTNFGALPCSTPPNIYAQVARMHAFNPLFVENGFITVGPRRRQLEN